jgi:hypothetical protein
VRVGRSAGCCVPSERQLTASYAFIDMAWIYKPVLHCLRAVHVHSWHETLCHLKKLYEFYVKDGLRYLSGARSQIMNTVGVASTIITYIHTHTYINTYVHIHTYIHTYISEHELCPTTAVRQRQHVDTVRRGTLLGGWSACLSSMFCELLVGASRFV